MLCARPRLRPHARSLTPFVPHHKHRLNYVQLCRRPDEAGMSAAFVAAARTRGRGFGYNFGNRGRSYLDEDDAGPSMCWLAIFGMVGVALISSGAWYAYDSFDDPRNIALKPYNQAVEAWNTVHRPEFAGTTFEWRVVSPTTKTVTVTDANGKTHAEVQSVNGVDPAASTAAWMPMDQAMVPEPLAPDQNKEGILQYEPLRWLARGILPAQPAGQLDRGPDGMAFWTGPDYKVQLRARDKDGKESVFDLEPIFPMKEVSVPANQKMCRMHHNNNFHNQRCWDKMAISSACLRLNHTSDGWKAPEGIQRGCAAGAELSFGRNCPGSNTAGQHALSSNPNCDFSNVTLTVRSMDDPHIIAQILTDGTLNFGYTPHENWVRRRRALFSLPAPRQPGGCDPSQLALCHASVTPMLAACPCAW